MGLKNTMSSGGSQSQKTTRDGTHLCEMPRIGKSGGTESRSVVVRGWEEAAFRVQGFFLG